MTISIKWKKLRDGNTNFKWISADGRFEIARSGGTATGVGLKSNGQPKLCFRITDNEDDLKMLYRNEHDTVAKAKNHLNDWLSIQS